VEVWRASEERNPLHSHRTTAPCSHRISADRCGSNSCGLQPSFHDTLRQLRWASAQQEHHVARGFWNYSECFWREAAAVRAFSVFWRNEKPRGRSSGARVTFNGSRCVALHSNLFLCVRLQSAPLFFLLTNFAQIVRVGS